jgi:altronate dehydratase large subunit
MADKFFGFVRENGSVGVRNFIAIIPSVFCAAKVAERIAANVPGTVLFRHTLGCGQVGQDLQITADTLVGIGKNPNFAGVLVVGLGCEKLAADTLAAGIAVSGKTVEAINIQNVGDSLQTIAQGTKLALDMQQKASALRREEVDVSALMIGLNCGSSDTTSGLVANPALGIASDKLVAQGGSAILTEIQELIGTEYIMARRAANDQVARDILAVVRGTEERLKTQTQKANNPKLQHLISNGNYEGGLSSLVEKSLGGLKKSGTARFVEVIKYGAAPRKKGLLLLDGPSHDGEASTGQVAAGAQIICFPTGRGTPTGFPGVPVIKITGNPRTYERMRDNIDINAGEVLSGKKTLQQMGEEIYQEILAVASGKECRAEVLGHDEQFSIMRTPF